MEFKTYRAEADYNLDVVYSFIPLGKWEPEYITKITVDELNMDMEDRGVVIRVSCNCKDYKQRRRRCKHITTCINILHKDIKIREEGKMKRYWCKICNAQCDTYEKEPKCYHCKMEMVESITR